MHRKISGKLLIKVFFFGLILGVFSALIYYLFVK